MPFGIGQFQNGNDGLGLVLAVSEGSLLAISLVSFLLHENLRGQNPTSRTCCQDARLAESVFRYTNQISLGLFGAIAIAGIIDAQAAVRAEPHTSTARARCPPTSSSSSSRSVRGGVQPAAARF